MWRMIELENGSSSLTMENYHELEIVVVDPALQPISLVLSARKEYGGARIVIGGCGKETPLSGYQNSQGTSTLEFRPWHPKRSLKHSRSVGRIAIGVFAANRGLV
jgi:hypothetical protein